MKSSILLFLVMLIGSRCITAYQINPRLEASTEDGSQETELDLQVLMSQLYSNGCLREQCVNASTLTKIRNANYTASVNQVTLLDDVIIAFELEPRNVTRHIKEHFFKTASHENIINLVVLLLHHFHDAYRSWMRVPSSYDRMTYYMELKGMLVDTIDLIRSLTTDQWMMDEHRSLLRLVIQFMSHEINRKPIVLKEDPYLKDNLMFLESKNKLFIDLSKRNTTFESYINKEEIKGIFFRGQFIYLGDMVSIRRMIEINEKINFRIQPWLYQETFAIRMYLFLLSRVSDIYQDRVMAEDETMDYNYNAPRI